MGKLFWTLPENCGWGIPHLHGLKPGKVLVQPTAEQLPVPGCLCTHLVRKA